MIRSYKDIEAPSYTKAEILKAMTSERYSHKDIQLAKVRLPGCTICCFNDDHYGCTRSEEYDNFKASCSVGHQIVRIDDLVDETKVTREPDPDDLPDFLPHGTITWDGKYKVIDSGTCADCAFDKTSDCEKYYERYVTGCTSSYRMSFVSLTNDDYIEEKEPVCCDPDEEDEITDATNFDLIGDEFSMNNGGSVVVEQDDDNSCECCYFYQKGNCVRKKLLVDDVEVNDCVNILFRLAEEPDPDINTRVTFENGDSALCKFSKDGCTGCCFDDGGATDEITHSEIDCSDVFCGDKIYVDYRTSLKSACAKGVKVHEDLSVLLGNKLEYDPDTKFSVRMGYPKQDKTPDPLPFKTEKKFSI